jgi:hypothetical protein
MNMQGYTRSEIEKAKSVQDFIAQQGFISAKNIKAVVKSGVWTNLPFTLKDIENSINIYGPSIPGLKGKTKKHASPTIQLEHVPRSVVTYIELLIDFMFINSLPFFIGLASPVQYAFVYHASGGRGSSSLWYIFTSVMAFWTSNGFRVRSVRMDLEGAMNVVAPRIRAIGIQVDQASPGDHVPQVERLIQTIKGTVRSLKASVPIDWPRLVLIRAVCQAVRMFNLVPSSVVPDGEVPYTRVLGIKPDYRRDSRLAFLEPVEAMGPESDNSMDQRTQTMFNLGPVDGSKSGAYQLLNPLTGRVVYRSQFTSVPLSNYHVSLLKQMVMRDKDPLGPTFEFRRGSADANILLDDSSLSDLIIESHPREYRPLHEVRGILPELASDFVSSPPISDLSLVNADVPSTSFDTSFVPSEQLPVPSVGGGGSIATLPSNASSYDQLNEQAATQDETLDYFEYDHAFDSSPAGNIPVLEESDHAESSVMEIHTSHVEDHKLPVKSLHRNMASMDGNYWKPVSEGSQRVRKAPSKFTFPVFNRDGGVMMDQKALFGSVFRITQTPKQAIKSRGDVAMQALINEIAQLTDKNTFEPVLYHELSAQQKKNVIPSFTFMEDKFDPTTREYIKTKARTVAGGHKQDRTIYESNWSPTVSSPALFTVAGIAALERRHVAVLDIPTAYPNASKETTGDTVTYIILAEMETAILVMLRPKFSRFVRDDGKMVVRLAKALYGLIESAKLWYLEISSTLLADGFTQNKYDLCVFNKNVGGKASQITICLHVDDMLLTSHDLPMIMHLHSILEAKYGTMALKLGPILSFLGMTFDFSKSGKVVIKMDKFIDEVLEKGNVPGLAESPAGENLFAVDDTLDLLPKPQQEYMHSVVAMILYLAKKTRPDLLTLIGFLTRRVNKFNIQDLKKLERGLRYLRATKDLPFTLSFSSDLQVVSSIDASYASSHDFKSISGATTSLGGASIHASSKAQSLIVKSSFEAELVATSDYAGRPIWVRLFLTDQGYTVGPATLEQDNQGTIAAIKNGAPSSDRSRHINIRFFWVSDRVKERDVQVQYVPTEFLLADLLTKPLQGSRFIQLRDRLLGIGGDTGSSGAAYVIVMH